MSEWKEVTLTDISSDISYGYTESAKYEKIGPKFLRITDIANGRLNWDTVPYCPISTENFSKYKLNPGDIVVARTGATTGANYTIKNNDPTEAVFASYLIRYRIDRKYADPNFIGQVLRSITWQDYVDSIAGGSAQPGANAKQLGSFPILLPPLPEQRAIASVLSSLDDKIDLLHRQNKTLEAMAETLFRQWFVEEADEGWEEMTLGDFFPVLTGKKDANFGTDDGLYLFFTCSQNPIKAPEYSFDGSAILLAGNGDFNIKRYVGKFEAYQRTYVLIPSDVTYFGFLYTLMKYYLNEITDGHQGSVINFITKGMITGFSFNLPRDRSSIANKLFRFNQIFEKVDSNTNQIHTLEKLRDTLLPKLMSGALRVTV